MANSRMTLAALLGACVGLLAGCADTNIEQYQPVTKIDAAKSQAAVDALVNPDEQTPSVAAVLEPKTDLAKSPVGDAVTVPQQPVPAKVEPKTGAQEVEPVESKIPPKLLIAEKEFPITTPENALRVSYDDIDPEKIFDLKVVTKDTPQYFPGWLRALNGQRIRIRGFMIPPYQDSDLAGFTLARDTSACCFGPNPKVCYLIDVWMRKGKTTNYIVDRPFDVVGVFHIGDKVEPGQLYTIDDAIVIPK